MAKLRIVFMGTPDFAASVLKSVLSWEGGTVLAVYAQPDRPSGRGRKVHFSAVKTLALEHGLPIYQPRNFGENEDLRTLAGLQPDVLVVAAYGLLLPQSVLDIPVLGAYNVHGSLLPQYRGAAPIQRALMNGDAVSGVTIMRMEAGLDSGPILLQQAVRIDPEDTAGTLFAELATRGGQLMVGALGMIAEGRVCCIAQSAEMATFAPKLSSWEEYVDWSVDAAQVHNRIRGLTPFPGAKSVLHLEGHAPILLHVEPGGIVKGEAGAAPGTLIGMDGDGLLVACGSGMYRLTGIRPSGKATMSARDFYNGRLKGLSAPFGILCGKQ